MNRTLRRRHRYTWVALAVFLAAVLAVASRARTASHQERNRAADRFAPTPSSQERLP